MSTLFWILGTDLLARVTLDIALQLWEVLQTQGTILVFWSGMQATGAQSGQALHDFSYCWR